MLKALSIRSIFGLVLSCFLSFSTLAQVPNRFEKKRPNDEAPEEQVNKDTSPQADQGPDEPAQRQDRKPTPPKRTEDTMPKSGFDWDKVSYGGSAWLTFGTYSFIMVNPRVGYRLTDKLLVGTGITYMYMSDRRWTPAFEQSAFGINPFANYEVFRGFGVGVEGEWLNADVYRFNPFTGEYETNREWIPHLFLGATYYPPIGGAFIGVYWNVIFEPNRSMYDNPLIRFGFMF